MSSELQTFLFVVGVWMVIGCLIIPLVLWLVTVYERHVGPVEGMLLTSAEREDERVLSLEDAFWRPCAPNPRLRYVSGDIERRLAEQRHREASR